MRTYKDAKTMAKSLRESLTARNVSLSHSECLEIVARVAGFADWNSYRLSWTRSQVSSLFPKTAANHTQPVEPARCSKLLGQRRLVRSAVNRKCEA
jgi:hypothetical protein